MMDSAETSNKAGESTRKRKRAVSIGEVGRCRSAIDGRPALAVIVAIVVVAVLDVAGCGGRDRRKRKKRSWRS
jgi:hypothetical protein